MTAEKNTPPVHIWETLRRLLNCNSKQLAAHLGVTARTLRTWETLTEEGQPAGKTASEAASNLLQQILRAADADVYALPIEWDRIRTIGGRR